MKKRIAVEKNVATNTINFYLVIPKLGRVLLMVTYFSKGVYSYFECTRSYDEIVGFKCWGRNPRLDHIIDRLPSLVKYGTEELMEEQEMKDLRPKHKRKRCDIAYDYSLDAA